MTAILEITHNATRELYRLMDSFNRYDYMINSGLLFEAGDLDRARKDLQSSAQAGLETINAAAEKINNYVVGFKQVSRDGNVFDKLQVAARLAAKQVKTLQNLDVGDTGAIEAFFRDSGKYAVALDSLRATMVTFDKFTKIIGSFLAQLATSFKTIDVEIVDKMGDDVTLSQLIADPKVEILTDEKVKQALQASIKQAVTAGGDESFSVKGIGNAIKKYGPTSAFSALALGAGAVALSGPLGIAAAAGGAIGAVASWFKKRKDNPFVAYEMNEQDILNATLSTQIKDLKAGIPLYVKAIKGTKITDQIQNAYKKLKGALDGASNIPITTLVPSYLERLNSGPWQQLMNIDKENTQRFVGHVLTLMQQGKEQSATNMVANLGLKGLNDVFRVSESRRSDHDLLSTRFHKISLSQLLFEDADQPEETGLKKALEKLISGAKISDGDDFIQKMIDAKVGDENELKAAMSSSGGSAGEDDGSGTTTTEANDSNSIVDATVAPLIYPFIKSFLGSAAEKITFDWNGGGVATFGGDNQDATADAWEKMLKDLSAHFLTRPDLDNIKDNLLTTWRNANKKDEPPGKNSDEAKFYKEYKRIVSEFTKVFKRNNNIKDWYQPEGGLLSESASLNRWQRLAGIL